MENDASQAESNAFSAFSYEILDSAAQKISELLSAVNQRCIAGGADIAAELFDWAEGFSACGRQAEAEFLYLHAVNLWERELGVMYPIHFQSLRHYALSLRGRSKQINMAVEVTVDPAPLTTKNDSPIQPCIDIQAA